MSSKKLEEINNILLGKLIQYYRIVLWINNVPAQQTAALQEVPSSLLLLPLACPYPNASSANRRTHREPPRVKPPVTVKHSQPP